ncbi:MAG TPA: hypothetical protein VMQ67_00630 [Candidatus Saccharimonadales bacterium]|nr:hypothetical protein [Candidatus Saccharimonadales bacterium]
MSDSAPDHPSSPEFTKEAAGRAAALAQPVNQPAPVKAPETTVSEKASTVIATSPPFWQGVLADIHVNASGLVMFGVFALGIIKPQYADQCTKIAALAATYLFSAAKNK